VMSGKICILRSILEYAVIGNLQLALKLQWDHDVRA